MLWPLVTQAVAQRQLEEAIKHARALLDSVQQRLPDALTAALGKAIEAWSAEAPATAEEGVRQALDLVGNLGYL